MSDAPERAVLAFLTAQALAFGVMLALLVIPANTLFLDAYGSKWLPATYIAIAVVGSAASAFVARAARRTRLVRVATVTLLALALLYAASWIVLLAGGVWVSAPLLVLFPIALQLGFVFIGGQAGRLLDVRQMKERFPRVVTGFAVGFLLGGLLGIPLLALLGSTEHLLVATTVAQLVFLALLLETERRFPEVRTGTAERGSSVRRPSAPVRYTAGLVLLLLTYQVLSEMGSQLLDFLLFSSAHEHFSGGELTRFLSGYTALLNAVNILFLALVAGPLMRRFGLRLGLVLNPAVVVGLLVLMTAVVAGPGAASIALLVLAGGAQLADIVLTNGTTRTSVNAAFQVVPVEERLAVQAVVEGIGGPVAIGATGAVLLVLNVLGGGTQAAVVVGVVVGVVWTAAGAAMYRSYTAALADEMRRRVLGADRGFDIAGEDAAVGALLGSEDARDVRLGLDLLSDSRSATAAVALREAARNEDPEVRVQALARLNEIGDARARRELDALVGGLARSGDPRDRRAAAAAASGELLIRLLDDSDAAVRVAALDAVAAGAADDPEIVRRVVAALESPRTAGSALACLRRLGAATVPVLEAALAHAGTPRPALVRAAAAAAIEHGPAVVEPVLNDPDRVVVVTALDALDAGGGRGVVPPDVLDTLFDDAVAHGARALAARETLGDRDSSLRRGLDDEVDLARRLVVAVLALRHGNRVREAVRVVDRADGQRRALGVEALDVILSREEAAVALPLVRRDLAPDEQAAALRRLVSPARRPDEWIADISDDPQRVWRSPWLALCARHSV